MLPAPPMPRELTPEVRQKLGLASSAAVPYRWTFAAIVVAIGSAPLLVAGYYRVSFAAAAFAFVAVPAMRWLTARDAERRERVFREGSEARGLVIAVEPGSDRTKDRIVRIEYLVNGERVKASVLGCPLARRGLSPGDEVTFLYEPTDPQMCLLAERTRRAEDAP